MTLLPPAELHWRTEWDAHLDNCHQCRTRPFGLCDVGNELILKFPALSSAVETETTTNEKEQNALT